MSISIQENIKPECQLVYTWKGLSLSGSLTSKGTRGPGVVQRELRSGFGEALDGYVARCGGKTGALKENMKKEGHKEETNKRTPERKVRKIRNKR